ncbi:MAG: immunity 53 family protein [Xenococcaceae cyanobacterium MO_167.B27]|nr:immunity 53 family protein [Xenococcaceae cyanobacterium MO_167.B27]
MEINSFILLQNWYESQCDGDWEHTYGIEIKTLDNSGWLILVDLLETELEDYDFQDISVQTSDNDWISCLINNGKFQGAGGSLNLLEILDIFREWVESKNCDQNRITD